MSGRPKTHAVIFPRPGRAIVDEVELPAMKKKDALVEIEYSFISNGTERWCLTGRLDIPGQPPLAFPHIPGYQAAGVVKNVGEEVTGILPGERVFSRNCRAPEGFEGSWWGGHVGVHVADRGSLIKLPETVSTFEGSGLLLAQVGYNGATRPRISPGDVAVVIGDGLVGQYAGHVLRHRGAYVIIAGLQKTRLELAAKFSADEVFDCSGKDLKEYMLERYPAGVPVVVETASNTETVRLAIDLLGRDGQLVLNGFYPPPESLLDWHWLRRKEITVYCPDSRNRARLEATLRLIEEGHVRVQELVTHTASYVKAPDLYGMLLDESAGFLGMVLDWRECQKS